MAFPDIHNFPVSHPGPYERQMGEFIAGLLRLFRNRVPDPESNARVLGLASIPDRWSAAHALFDEVRLRLLAAMKAEDRLRCAQYDFEESCLQAMYNATNPPDPFDPGSSFFVAGQAIGLARVAGVPVEAVVAVLEAVSEAGAGPDRGRTFGIMNVARFMLAVVASLLALLVLNMFVFPLVFPSGVTPKYANPRAEPLVLLHLGALIATAALLTVLAAVLRPAPSSLGAAVVGAITGLLASLPSALHTQALTDMAISAHLAPVIWTSATWSVAAAVAHWAYRWRSVRGT